MIMANIIKKIKDEITLENVLIIAIKTPGVKIKRDVFLRKELLKHCPEDVIKEAIRYNPARAGIPKSVINKVAKSVISFETKKVSSLSVVVSLPSSINPLTAVGSASADITSYFAHIFRVVQELAYLYGFPQFDLEEDNIDSETMDFLMVFLGVMFGVQGASTALNKLADTIAKHIAKKLAQRALTKGTIYPFVKQIATKIGVHMTKQVFADTLTSAIPVLGSLASGGLTWVMFKPYCIKLQKNLMTYNLCDPDYYRVVVDAEVEEVEKVEEVEEVQEEPIDE